MENSFSKHNHDYHDEDDVVDDDVDDNVVSGAFVVPACLDHLHLL